MKKQISLFYELKSNFLQEKRRYIFVLLLFGAGILFGSLSAVCLESTGVADMKSYFNSFFSAYALQGIAKKEAFRISLLNYGQLFFWLWLSGWSFWLFPISIFQVILKGFRTGYTITYLIKCYHFRGIFITILAILPQNLVLLPVLCFYTVFLIRFRADRSNLKKNILSPAIKNQIYGNHAIITLLVVLFLLFCAFIEGYVVPTMIQPFCRIFI